MPKISVIIPAHNPHAGRLARTLRALRGQTLPIQDWELLLIDNASSPATDARSLLVDAPANLRLVVEPRLGLSHARRRGFIEATGEFLVLVDDDNLLAPDYLAQVRSLFLEYPDVGMLGGRSMPEFETPPPPWIDEFKWLLALRDLGPAPIIGALEVSQTGRHAYPFFAPIGAGMALRAAAGRAWLDKSDPDAITDRKGRELSSGGDNDIVISVMRAGWKAAYFPELELTHLIPSGRTTPEYLARLNRGIQKSWMQVLLRHDMSDWPVIPRWTVPLRQAKAWFTRRAWSGPVARIHWQGACGHFEGRLSR